jgi:MFS family permease
VKSGLCAFLATALLTACYAISSTEKIELTFGGIDLGRHLKNGELLLSSTAPAGTAAKLLHTNFYSYAMPDFEFVNHHWLTGVIYYLVWKRVGFAGLNAFHVLLGCLTFLLFFRMAQKAAGWAIAAAVALAMMPILRLRASLRPEIFTLLFGGVFLWFLWNHYNGALSWRSLLVLPAIEVLWVNLHIGFILGPVFIGAFMLAELLKREPQPNHQRGGVNPWETEFYKEKVSLLTRWLGILALTLLATLVNPSGIYGAVYPLTIWSNYGIDVIENHSIPYLESHGFTGEFLLIKLTLIVLYLSFFSVYRRAARFPMGLFILAGFVGGMGWLAIRNQTIMAMFALAAIGINAGLAGVGELWSRWRTRVATALAVMILAGVYYNGRKLLERKETIGLGLYPDSSAAADFLRASHLQGPVLNNFNIGGYLTHYLYPQYRVYVDSRPEAYPAEFLGEKYQAPLNEETLWAGLLDEYQFNIIFFCQSSVWENQFCFRRAYDPKWALVFRQGPMVILVRRNAANQSFIQQHEIPPERLSVKQ